MEKVVLPLALKLLFLLVNVPLGCLRMMKNLVRRRRREARELLLACLMDIEAWVESGNFMIEGARTAIESRSFAPQGYLDRELNP